MPINKKKMSAMKKEYGSKKGEDVYYAMEMKMKKMKSKMKGKKMKKESTKESYKKAMKKLKSK